MEFKEYLAEQLKDPEFAKAYEGIQPEMNVIRAIIDVQASQDMAKKEAAERNGTA
jgi:hypothetical protein